MDKIDKINNIDGINKIMEMKSRQKITMLTAYDYPTAKLEDEAGIDIILVGDSLAMVVLGHENTTKITMQEMLHHTKAVSKAVKNALIIGDMPIHSYDTENDAVKNAKLFVEAGADCVKIEGNKPEIVRAIKSAGIEVMGHIGLTPQTITNFKVQGKDEQSAKKIISEALSLEKAGVFSIVLECIPANLAKEITQKLKIPTIGIGAGKFCGGQVLVCHDMLGLFDKFKPRFVKRYAELSCEISKAFKEYKEDVVSGRFPDEEHSYK